MAAMASTIDTAAPPARRRRRAARRAGFGLAALIAGGLAIVWLDRRPIAIRFIDRELRARGVPARYRIVAIGPGEQRIADLVLGDPAAPDLVVRSATLYLRYGLRGPVLAGIAADGVRLRGRIERGRLRLGAIDRLLPPPSNAPFALPDLDVTLADTRMRLETPAGAVGLALAGEGNLASGFAGRLAAVAPGLALGGCIARAPAADVAIRTNRGRPALAGPLRVAALDCRGLRTGPARADIAVAFAGALAGWDGSARIGASDLAARGIALAGLDARLGFAGDAGRTTGRIDASGVVLAAGGARAARASVGGTYEAGRTPAFAGDVGLGGVALGPAATDALGRAARSAAATPAGPLLAALAAAAARAARDADARATLDYRGGVARVGAAAIDSASGARLRFAGGSLDYAPATARLRVSGTIDSRGGGLPEGRVLLRRSAVGGIEGLASFAPYAAGGARLALAPVAFAASRRGARFSTRLTLDGPLAGGRIEGLTAPLAGTFRPDGGFTLDPGCVPIGFGMLAIAGTRFDPAVLRACPTTGASLIASGRLGARIDRPALGGRAGGTPLSIAADGIDVGAAGFSARGVAVRLGPADRRTRLDLATLDGASGPRGLGGGFAGGAGQIGAVPLLFADAAGRWTLAGAVLALAGRLTLGDAQAAAPRFQPLVAEDVALVLRGGVIRATGTLRQPKTRDDIAGVTIAHDLGAGSGEALLSVRGIAFTPLLQPEALTRLTLGLIADVRGTIAGDGIVRWSPAGVTSSGDFTTGGIDLAAAFGPVKGIRGQIHFSDLLALETPPGQTATIAEANPGVAVTDGTVRYRLLAGQRVQVESGHWPFAGGALVLRPTVMDFSRDVDRHLTFAVESLDAARFIEQLALPNIAATGTFDGVMPMIFDARGGRIEGGHLVVRPGGGTLAYVGEIGKARLGVYGKLAFDALKSIRYQHLSIDLDGRLDGELVSRVGFNGVNQQPLTSGTPFTKTLRKLPFTFNITLRAPFRGLMGSARDFIDPGALVRDSLATRAPAPVQPPSSETSP